MTTKTIIIIAIFAVLVVVGTRVVVDPPFVAAFADKTNTEIKMPQNEHKTGQQFTVGDITIMNAQARETVPGASVGGGYMIVTNSGSQNDRLLGGQTAISSLLELHEMTMENDVMKMRQLNDGLTIKAGETLILQPGGFHIMFMDLKSPLKKDTSFKATLNFEKAGSVDVNFNVVDMKTLTIKH